MFETRKAESQADRDDAAFRQSQTPKDAETQSFLDDETGAMPLGKIADAVGAPAGTAAYQAVAPLAMIGKPGKRAGDWWAKPLIRVVEDGNHVGRMVAKLARKSLGDGCRGQSLQLAKRHRDHKPQQRYLVHLQSSAAGAACPECGMPRR